jgi:hypothetical protein
LQDWKRNPFQLRCPVDQIQQRRVDQPVVNEPSLAPGSHNAGFTQDHQLLGDVGL